MRIGEEANLGERYANLDSTDRDVVAELVGALQTNDLLAIHEGEHSDEDAIGYPYKSTLLFLCILLKDA